MSQQSIFNTVAQHLITQDCQAMNQGTCAYRGDDPRFRCAVGILITDSVYESYYFEPEDDFDPTCDQGLVQEDGRVNRLEERSICDAEVQYAVCESLGIETLHEPGYDQGLNTYDLLEQLQGVHDNADVGIWREKLRSVADFFKLEHPACLAEKS